MPEGYVSVLYDEDMRGASQLVARGHRSPIINAIIINLLTMIKVSCSETRQPDEDDEVRCE